MSHPAESKSGFYDPDFQDNPEEELKKFLIYFLDEKEPYIKAEKLHIFARSYLPASNQQTSCKTRSDFFGNVICQIPAILNMLGIFNIENAEYLKVDLHNDKSILNLQRAGLCLETLCLCLENSQTSQELHSSLKITLTALLQSYSHCKESEQIYGNLLEEFACHLGYFFKKIEDLQTAMLLILEDGNRMGYSDEDIHSIYVIAHNIGKLCMLVSNLDQLISTKLWKVFIKYVLKYKECLQPNIDVSPVLVFLSSEVINTVKMCKYYLSKVANEVDELEDIKVCSFQLNAVKKIYEVFKGISSDNVNCFRNMIIELYHLFILCYLPDVVEGKYLESVKNVLLKNIQPLTELLFTDSLFKTSVLQLNTEAFESEYQLAVILLKLVSMNFLQSSIDVSQICPKYVFTNFFSVLEQNKPEDDLIFLSSQIPHSLFSQNEDQKLFTLYEIAYAHLSTYLKYISDSQFLNLKDIIKKHLTSDIPSVSLLISDTVMYRLRCSSTEYLCAYCISFTENWSKIYTSINMQIFLKRMLKFLPSLEKKKILERNATLQILEMDSRKLQHRYGIPKLLQSASENLFDQNEQICLLMHHIEGPFSNDLQNKNETYCKLLELCALFVNTAQCAVLLKFIEFASRMFKSEVFEVQMAVLTFVKAWKKKNISSLEPQFEEIIKSFAMLIAETLCCKNYIVQNEAISTYVTLAKFNPHISIIQETLRIIPFAKTVLKSYLNAIPLHNFLSEKEQNKNFQTQLSLFKELPISSSKS